MALARKHFPKLKSEPKAKWINPETWQLRESRVGALVQVKHVHRELRKTSVSEGNHKWGGPPPTCFSPAEAEWVDTLLLMKALSEQFIASTAKGYRRCCRHDRQR